MRLVAAASVDVPSRRSRNRLTTRGRNTSRAAEFVHHHQRRRNRPAILTAATAARISRAVDRRATRRRPRHAARPRFNRFLSAQASYMRPLYYVTYRQRDAGRRGRTSCARQLRRRDAEGADAIARPMVRRTERAASGSRAARDSASVMLKPWRMRIMRPYWPAEVSSTD
jgi:hypothetical protein